MTLEEQKRRYQSDAAFYALVRQFRMFMEAGQFSIGECKDALNLAAMIIASETMAPIVMPRTELDKGE